MTIKLLTTEDFQRYFKQWKRKLEKLIAANGESLKEIIQCSKNLVTIL